jgi:hypothetical protein
MVWTVPAVALRRLRHPHDTFPCPSHQDQQPRTFRTTSGSARHENRPTKDGHLRVPEPRCPHPVPSHPRPSGLPPPLLDLSVMTLNHTLRPCKRSPTSLTQLENGASKSTLFSVHKKVNTRKKISKLPHGSGRAGGQFTPSRPPSRHFPVFISPRSIVQVLENARRFHPTREPPHQTWPPRPRYPPVTPSHPRPI